MSKGQRLTLHDQLQCCPSNVGTSNVMNMVQTGNGLPSLFLINLYTLYAD
jgi:hypothetical protein